MKKIITTCNLFVTIENSTVNNKLLSVKKNIIMVVLLLPFFCGTLYAQTIEKQLEGFDKRMEKIMEDWNVPGCAIGIIKDGKLVYAQGFGYRDLEKKLPATPNTLFPIASNTKLFTAIAVGLLVNDSILYWDQPVKLSVPQIQFNTENLNNEVTLRDMLAHRTGISRCELASIGTTFNRSDLFDRIKYMEPLAPIRERFLYNNMMYMAAGQIIEIKTGKKWEVFLTENILFPLEMNNTVFSVEEMVAKPEFAKPYRSNFFEDSVKLIDFSTDVQATGPAGSINSNIYDLSNWVICNLANGKFKNAEIIPPSVIQETFRPASFSDLPVDDKEVSYRVYGMGREMTTYKGHLMSDHGGHLPGYLSQITFFPDDNLGIIILTNSDEHRLRTFLPMEIADRILDLDKTLWHERYLERAQKAKEEDTRAMENQNDYRIKNTTPSHDLKSFVGEYENPLYGKMEIKEGDGKLTFHFRIIHYTLNHIHYDQFETPEDDIFGSFKLSFFTNDEGKIDKVITHMDDSEVAFKRMVPQN